MSLRPFSLGLWIGTLILWAMAAGVAYVALANPLSGAAKLLLLVAAIVLAMNGIGRQLEA
jgi:hypothetical protein